MEAQQNGSPRDFLSSIFQGYDFSRVNNAVWTSNEDPDMSAVGGGFPAGIGSVEVYEEFPKKFSQVFQVG